MADLIEDDILKLIQLQTILLLLRALSSLSNIATSAPALEQMIVFIGRLAGRSHFDDLSKRAHFHVVGMLRFMSLT